MRNLQEKDVTDHLVLASISNEVLPLSEVEEDKPSVIVPEV
jgi:hypothetical protein